MHLIDWLFVILPIAVVVTIAIVTQRQMRSVADFMASGRVAGPYLLAVAAGEMQAGAVVFVAVFEVIAQAGFTITWWQMIAAPIGVIIAISGFVIYRFRATRAMTLAQFFELRYSKRFRLFTGLLAFVAGILNFGIIPSVGARFMVHFLGLPHEVTVGALSIPTFVLLMAVFLSITLFVTLAGGFITVMITDCVEGIMSQIFYLIIIVALLSMFSWTEISEVLSARPTNQSMLNPFDSLGLSDFNLWYVLMGVFLTIYGTGAWQNAGAYRTAAITPHASVMAGLLGRWREMGKVSVVTLLAVCAVTFLEHPDFAAQSAAAAAETASIENPQIQRQMEVPIALSHLLPIGIKGILCAVLLMGIVGGDSTHLHSWGSIFVQDVLVPLRRKPFGARAHIRALRLSITGVAVFAFFFGTLFQQTEYIMMWWAVTTAVYVGGAGACVIGGLYWSRGTSAGAWAALLTGSTMAGGGILARQIFGEAVPLNGIQISFTAALSAIAIYVIVSLLTCREKYNLDRMLHRGGYAEIAERVGEVAPVAQKRGLFERATGISSHFTFGDKVIAGGLFGWSVFWFLMFVVGTIWNLVAPWPTSVWSTYWHIVGIGIPVLLTFVTGVWFTVGGLQDIRLFFQRLKARTENPLDDGTVVDHQNLDEAVLEKKNPS